MGREFPVSACGPRQGRRRADGAKNSRLGGTYTVCQAGLHVGDGEARINAGERGGQTTGSESPESQSGCCSRFTGGVQDTDGVHTGHGTEEEEDSLRKGGEEGSSKPTRWSPKDGVGKGRGRQEVLEL